MGKHHQEYLHNVASSVMGQIGGVRHWGGASAFSDHASDSNEFPQELWNQYGSKVMDALRKMGSSARGRIAACGVEHGSSTGSLCHWEVNQGRDLNAAFSGDELLTLLASYVVVAAIVDIIRAQVQKMRDDEHATEEEFDRGMADYIHHGPNKSEHHGDGEPVLGDAFDRAYENHFGSRHERTSVTGSRSVTESSGGTGSVRGTRSVTRSVPSHKTH